MKTYTATAGFFTGRDDSAPDEHQVRYHFTVSPFRPASLTEPAEHPTVDIQKVEIHYNGQWWDCDGVLWDIIVCDGKDDLDAWLLSEANASEEQARDDAADHRREMLREDAA